MSKRCKKETESFNSLIKRINSTIYKDIKKCEEKGEEVVLDANIHQQLDYYEREIFNILKFKYFKNLTFEEQLTFAFKKRIEAIERGDI